MSAAVSRNQVAQDDEEQENNIISVDRLQDAGIAAADITKLKEAGIGTVAGVMMQTRKKLLDIKGLSEAKIDKIQAACMKTQNLGTFISGREALANRSKILKISTGSKSFDDMLGGGFESRSITELHGEFRTGKTQICHHLCVMSQLPVDMGGANGKVAYIDTEGTFRPERIQAIAARYGLDPDEALDNIVVGRAFNHEMQIQLINVIAASMAEDQYGLVIVDSITALFRVDFSGRGELSERQQKLGQLLSRLMRLAEEFNVAIVMTNQVMSDPSGGAASFVVDPKKPVGGHVIAHAATTRISLRKGRAEQRIAKLIDSPSLPETECIYQITNDGISDAKD